MMSATVVRRFDLRVDQDKALDDVSDLLRKLVRQESGIGPAQIKRAEALSLLEVRLQGDSSAISRVVAQVAGWPNVRIQHDVIREAASAGAGLVGLGPRGALIRTGVEPGSWKAPVDSATSSASVTVAIVDSGIMVDHPELKNNLWSGTVDGGRRTALDASPVSEAVTSPTGTVTAPGSRGPSSPWREALRAFG